MNEPSVSTIDFWGGEKSIEIPQLSPPAQFSFGTFGFAPEDDSVVRLAFFRPWEQPWDRFCSKAHGLRCQFLHQPIFDVCWIVVGYHLVMTNIAMEAMAHLEMVYLSKAWWFSMANWQCHNQRVSFDREKYDPKTWTFMHRQLPWPSHHGHGHGSKLCNLSQQNMKEGPNKVAKSSTTRYPMKHGPHEVPATSPSWLVVKPQSYHQVEVHLEPSP